ncbi:hypothetical protein GCM10010517_16750 [Streptosporangium fragile]|uniref:DUF4404 domain-containing protein n=1 Tax=Streptosporangium fragile TaxID=46186 RepID=A0ABN3VSZ1_9ACTN
MNENSGIYIGGNARVQADAMAAGPGARATSNKSDTGRYEDLHAQLDALLVELRKLTAADPGLQEAVDAGEALSQELQSPNPETGRLIGLLHRLGAAAEKVGPLATAIASIATGINALP